MKKTMSFVQAKTLLQSFGWSFKSNERQMWIEYNDSHLPYFQCFSPALLEKHVIKLAMAHQALINDGILIP